MSLKDRPLTAKFDVRVLMLDAGEGRKTLAAVLLAVSESLLPNFTSQEGPPSCQLFED